MRLLIVETMSYIQKLKLHKTLQQLYLILDSMDFIILPQYFTLYHLLIQDVILTQSS